MRYYWIETVILYHVFTYKTDKDIGGSCDWFDGGCSHGELHEASHETDDGLHDTPVVQYSNHRTEVHDHRQGLKKSMLF